MKAQYSWIIMFVFLTLITVNFCEGDSKHNAETPPGNPQNEPRRQPAASAGQDASQGVNDSKQSEDVSVKSDGANASPENVKQDETLNIVKDAKTSETESEKIDDGFDLDSDERLVIYQRVFMEKRQRHLSAVEDMMTSYNYEQQYKLVNMVFDKMQEMYSQSRKTLTEYGFEPGMPFPGGEAKSELLEALSVLLENVAFLSDIVLRLPDISAAIYNQNRPFRDLAKWAIKFVGDTKFFDEVHSKLLHLLSQELKIVKRDADFVNPFRKDAEPIEFDTAPNSVKKKKTKPPKKRGPRMSKQEL